MWAAHSSCRCGSWQPRQGRDNLFGLIPCSHSKYHASVTANGRAMTAQGLMRTGCLHERLYLLRGKAAIFVASMALKMRS